MKFLDSDGNEHSKDLNYAKYKRSRSSRSKLANSLYDKIVEIFPNYDILEEFPCVGLKPILFMDFLILGAGIRMAFEADGTQHKKYTPYFHGSKANFIKAKMNDVRKNEWAEFNNIRIFRVESDKDIDMLLENINE